MDARWFDVDSDVSDAIEHFSKACEIFKKSEFDSASLTGYMESMALMHSVQSGYTSLEGALLRIFDILGEHRPTGEKWHQDLTRRSAQSLTGAMARPAILSHRFTRMSRRSAASVIVPLGTITASRHRRLTARLRPADVL